MSDSPATITRTTPAKGITVTPSGSTSSGLQVLKTGPDGKPIAIGQNNSAIQVVSTSDVGATATATTAPVTKPGGLDGREPFLYAGVGLVVLTVAVLGPLLRRRPDLKVRMGLPYLAAFGLVSYALDGSWQKSLALAAACLLIVFGITMLRLWRWRIARRPGLHAVAVKGFDKDRYVRQVLPALTELGFQPEAGYEVQKPAGSLAVLTLRHRKDPVVAQVRLSLQGSRRYPHLVFATRLRGGEQVWTWNIPGALPPQPATWTSYHHAATPDPKDLYKLHQQHLAARPAVTLADKEADVAKRIVAQTEWELSTQATAGMLAAEGDRYKLTGRAIWRWTAVAFLAFLGVPFERMRLPAR
jgi:hypothetical protein